MERLLIGIAGGSGSGKTTLIGKLKEQFRDEVSLLHLDDYHKNHDELPLEQRRELNYDHPREYDMALLVEQLKLLRQGKCVETPVYDFSRFIRSENKRLVQPKRVILVEGTLLLTDRRVRELLDIKIFVDTDSDVRILRHIRREVTGLGRSLDEAIDKYLNTVKPIHENFVDPSKHFADLVVLEGGENQVAVDMLIAKVRSHLDTE